MSQVTRARAAPTATSSWKLKATLRGVYGSLLYEFFDSSSKDGVVSLLDEIKVESLTVTYTYEGKDASKFVIDGTLFLGSLPLQLNFEHTKSEWQFKANLSLDIDPPETTIQEIATHIFGPELDLPDFVGDIKITPPKDKDAVGLEIISQDSTENPEKKDLLFVAWLDFSGFSFQAVQFQAAGPSSGPKPAAQRAFLIAVNPLAMVKDIPLVGDLPQPFDQMLFVYVQGQKKGGDVGAGLNHKDMTSINALLAGQRAPLPYKITKKKYNDTDIVLPSGSHFMLLRKSPKGAATVVLDYVFGKPKGSQSYQAIITQYSTALVAEETSNPGSSKAPYEKSIGPLSIRNMGLKFATGSPPTLSILMDASVVVGPIGVGLLGFGLVIPIKKGTTLHNLPVPTFAIAGLAVSFDRSPVILSGMFEHLVTKESDTYQGAATISFTPYLFQAAGFYGEIGVKPNVFESSFVYFMLNGPLATLEFAEIKGVTGGFGYNTFLKFPDAKNVTQFPMINVPQTQDPKDALSSLISSGWFFPQKGSFWVAAGLTVLAFEVLQVQAVVVIEWNPSIKLGLFGVATADMPPGAPDARKFVHVQLGIVAAVDFNAGTLKIEGQLTPSSYVLDPSCHLEGGFGFYTWFSNSESSAAGDFVFTIGGYHRSFKPPAQYPTPPRLAISWSYDSAISIRGEAYFAITPKACMGGGRLDASLTLGPLYAFFDAYADFLINYKPFHFTAEGGLSVGVRFTLDLWICTIHIGVEISATLYLQGPPIAGRVHVNFWVFGFDIDFGHLEGPPDPILSWQKFYEMVLQADLSKGSQSLLSGPADSLATAPLPPPHVFSCNRGLIPSGKQKSNPNDECWNVRGAVFQFTIGCKVAIDHATIITGQLDSSDPLPPLEVNGNGQPIFARPMHLISALSSKLKVTITPVPPKVALFTEGTQPKVPRWDTAQMVIKSVPTALWGKYDSKLDPSSSSNSDPNHLPDLLSGDKSTIPLPMAIQISSPKPVLSSDLIPAFQYKTFFTETVSKVPFPTIPAANPAWYPTPEAPPEKQWDTVRTLWSGTPKLGPGAAENAVKLWANLSLTQWDLTSVGAVTGKAPAKLLVKETFETLFLEAPRVGVAAAA
ncbi:hypothetical protein D8B26_007691 [Coccidioides posadasii str. Silveira]|uniref:DUF6603 domain-containing protein n=3 Tax=Coccidioides posadasii TaxID=199306 RepID=E9D2P9_COCPS|nr:hypothetical protein CPC735_016920 [Coccidioides posadasii C735 delta SOWgp]EER25091.1 hypothetical protein CPC735_016920 [Coccidioides posadasii C735 delta SOWgp]EFW19463.1 conserved hypothetical protein [Coccidioides posadasii str. Silveira]KMM71925.1 hypothetical protein CPAG_08225 [Coccidioides posadasii RMSCC 3488]QVM13076.1 hypothetical protein D8B26_007691 [Coccidioides posadasii str. Silveira]|eukprot:XP_003067236.1 hypothetical protein CPC735_016920 [Coccidioides posadasii C735 delta SOWgp]